MCGRYTNFHPTDAYQDLFGVRTPNAWGVAPRYNVCPTESVPVVFRNRAGERQAGQAAWGLIPHWVKHPTEWRGSTFNARSENAHEKPAFRTAFQRGRVLLPASGFYEWQATEGGKVPHFIDLEHEKPMAFAGLMDVWRSRDGRERRVSCTVLTTSPNEVMARLHDRMPVLLEPDQFDAWLDPNVTSRGPLEPLLRPAPPEGMRVRAVSRVGEHPPA